MGASEQALNIGIEKLEEVTVEKIEGFQNSIQREASIFLNIVMKAQTSLRDLERKMIIESKIKKDKGGNEKEVVTKYEKKRLDDSDIANAITSLKNIGNATHRFQEQIFKGFEKKFKYIFVWRDLRNGEVILYEIDNPIEMIRLDTQKGAQIIARFPDSGDKLKKAIESLPKDTYRIKDDSKDDKLTRIYREILRRINISKKHISKGAPLLLWQPDSVWKKLKVQSAGSIDEAYAALRMTRSELFMSISNMEIGIDRFVTEKDGVLGVTNLSGSLAGDFLYNGIEYAVKGIKATLAAISDLINVAQDIIESNDAKKVIEEAKNNLEQKARPINSFLTAKEEETYKDIIDEIKKEIPKNEIKLNLTK